MSRLNLENRNIRKLSRVGNGKTYTSILPIEAIREFDWQKKQKLEIVIDSKRKCLVIKDCGK